MQPNRVLPSKCFNLLINILTYILKSIASSVSQLFIGGKNHLPFQHLIHYFTIYSL